MKSTYLVMRMVENPRGMDEDPVLDIATATVCTGTEETKAVANSGAWNGSVFAVWELPAGTHHRKAQALAGAQVPDRAMVLTDLGILAEVDRDLVRDAVLIDTGKEG